MPLGVCVCCVHWFIVARWIILTFLVTTSVLQDGYNIIALYTSSSYCLLCNCWAREGMWVVMVILIASCHGNTKLGTSSHGRDGIIDIWYIFLDQYWFTVWSSVSHVICMWSIACCIVWSIIVHSVLLEKWFAYHLWYSLILSPWKLQLVSEGDHMI